MYGRFLIFLGSMMTPNQITILRGTFIIPAAILWFQAGVTGKWLGIFIMVLSWFGDHLDGAVARACGMVSDKGKWLDPAVDKVVFYSTSVIFLPVVNITLLFLMFVLDIVSTFARTSQPGADQGANWFGKYKLAMQVSMCLSFALAQVLRIDRLNVLANDFLLIAVLLGLISVSMRLNAWRWFPNMISASNAFSGLISMYFASNGKFHAAVSYIFIGMFLDLLDGPLARRLKVESKFGMYMDDIADGTTFGLATGFLVLTYTGFDRMGIFCSVIYTVCVIFRLYDYTRTKNDPQLKPPKGFFRGLPSPAGSSIILAAVLLDLPEQMLAAVALVSGMLMIAFRFNWIHFNRVFPKKLNKLPLLILLVILLILVFPFKYFISTCILIYVLSPIWCRPEKALAG